MAFLHFLSSSSCQENTQLTVLWQGQGSLFVLVLLCFTAGLHKTTVHEQLPQHTNTHASWHADITSVSRCSYTEYKKKKSLHFLGGVAVKCWVCDSKASPFPCPWCLSGLGGSDKGNRWGLKRMWGGTNRDGEWARTEGENERQMQNKKRNERSKSETRCSGMEREESKRSESKGEWRETLVTTKSK